MSVLSFLLVSTNFAMMKVFIQTYNRVNFGGEWKCADDPSTISNIEYSESIV